jgi:poly(3-hydroxybutyrate) depolymerase
MSGKRSSIYRQLKFTLTIIAVATLVGACGGNRDKRNDPTDTARPVSSPVPTIRTAPKSASTLTPAPTATPAPRAIPTTASLKFVTGRNDYVIEVDNTPRKFLVYVPKGYDPKRATPVVIMLHGSNQGGPLMYESTNWAAKADAENFIVVFPTSWKYRLLEDNQFADKWNSASLSKLVVPGTELKDDVQFMRAMLDQLYAAFNVDRQRIYATGFSNGGGFVLSRLIPDMNDVFAAYATSGAGLLDEALPDPLPTGLTAPVYSVLGSNDEKVATITGAARPFPMIAEQIVSYPVIGDVLTNATAMLSLSSTYTVEYDKPYFTTLTFNHSSISAHNQFKFRMINGMGHLYPSGDNNRSGLDVADLFWDFFKQYTKP